MSVNRHKWKCKVCNSENCKAIEKDYINGLSLRELELKWPEISADSFWNHCNAYPKLRKRRSENIESVLDRIIENGSLKHIKIDGHLVHKAVVTKMKVSGKLPTGTTNIQTSVAVTVTQQEREQKLERGLSRFGFVVGEN